jgi:hypothetical protein
VREFIAVDPQDHRTDPSLAQVSISFEESAQFTLAEILPNAYNMCSECLLDYYQRPTGPPFSSFVMAVFGPSAGNTRVELKHLS